MTEELTVHREENFALGRLMPQNVRELAWFAGEASKSGLFQTSADQNQTRPLSTGEAFMLMSTGIELGLTPLQGLRDLSLIKGKVDVPPAVLAAKIASDPRVTLWDPNGDDQSFEIKAKRSDRDNGCTVRITWDDISQADKTKHAQHAEDLLYARCVRRIVKRYFSDLKYGLASNVAEESARVIDIAAVEQKVGPQQSAQPCEKCGAVSYLHPSGNGGVYSQCSKCGHRQSPPQAVRDTVRGRGSDFVDNDEPRDPTPDEQNALSQQWQKDIWSILSENMVDESPHPTHRSILDNWGWHGEPITGWLGNLPLDNLADLRSELASPAL